MATTNFKGQPVKLIGEFIQVGKVAPDFELVKTDLSSFSLKDLNGKNVILNIFPSLDTSVCATSVRKFNKMAAGLKDTVVLAISKDLPFAHGRFCTTEGIENVIPLSDFRFSDFDESYGVRMAYDELEKEGFIYTIAAKGCFVAPLNTDLLRETNLKKIEDYMEKIVHLAASCNLSEQELTEMLHFMMEE